MITIPNIVRTTILAVQPMVVFSLFIEITLSRSIVLWGSMWQDRLAKLSLLPYRVWICHIFPCHDDISLNSILLAQLHSQIKANGLFPVNWSYRLYWLRLSVVIIYRQYINVFGAAYGRNMKYHSSLMQKLVPARRLLKPHVNAIFEPI